MTIVSVKTTEKSCFYSVHAVFLGKAKMILLQDRACDNHKSHLEANAINST